MADVILVNSKFTATTFANTFKKLHARGIHPVVLYPAVNVYQFDKPHSCGYDKRLRENVECLEELKSLAERNGVSDRVNFITSCSTAERNALLSECLCVLCTPKDEHFGIVPLEAMAAYKPVIACDSGGPVETIKNEVVGFLCNPTPQEFSLSMAKLIQEPQMAKKMGENARHHVMESFSTKIFGQHLNRLLAYVARVSVDSSSPAYALMRASSSSRARAPGKAEQTIIFSNPCTPFIIIIIVIIIMYRVLIKCGLVRWEWPKGSIEETVQNAVKSWEMELSHRTRLNDFKTINPEKFKLIVNGPPMVAYKFKHWGYFEGPFQGHAPTGEMVEFLWDWDYEDVDETRHGEQISDGRVLRTGVFRKGLVRGRTGAEISGSSTSTSSARPISCKRHKAIPARGREARRPGRRQLAGHALQPENLGTTATFSPEPWRNTQDLTEPRQPRFPLNRGVTRKISQNHDRHAFP
ncbi:GDP-Man:Man(1)GlcNAc(2)-PP-Dol alpha-1,3-mannosyltransferase [Citrus sinensis]|uniref:GDP-Man:Man(1)GlcNAc(2)-PP-Dol alpha-1,3-mannosyltransferase n=1 Tax=Citrus sinensis TaxID=2711 RepID=A0ACB8LZL2_CITSI|nr:GDP-Man:Man(1)GlcNAc(2)-PP-Dol alpha-1,3-mannosyltransferase [Citrus sinensis]